MSVKQQKTVKAMAEAIKYADAKKPQPYDATATVVRTEGNIAWVHFDGGAEETPVRKTINAKDGDIVQVRVGGGDAWIVGNATAPPTDDRVANIASELAINANETANVANKKVEIAINLSELAEEVATRAQASADGKNTIYYGSTTPTTGQSGDTWFNGAEDNAIYIHNGTTWVKEELGEDAIANLSITNAKIVNGTIQSAKIANLDAGKITSGTIDTNRLDVAGIISVGGLATDAEVAVAKSEAIADGRKYADNYLTVISGTTGISVHNQNNVSDYVNITSNAVHIASNGTKVASFTPTMVTLGISGQNRVQIQNDSNYQGLEIFDNSNNSIAWFGGGGIRVGKSGADRFLVNTSSLQAYDSSNNKYFEVSASGITYGSTAVASQSYADGKASTAQSNAQTYADGKASTAESNAKTYADGVASTAENNASKVATTYITRIDDAGIKVHAKNNTTSNYTQINASGIYFYNGGNAIASFTPTLLRLGESGSSRVQLQNDTSYQGLEMFNNTSSILWIGTNVSTGNTTARIGETANSQSRVVIQPSGIDFISRSSSGTDVNLAHIGYASGTAQSGTAVAPYYTFGTRKSGSTIGNYSLAVGDSVTASGYCSVALGSLIEVGTASGTVTTYLSSSGVSSFAQGQGTTASGHGAFAGGGLSVASGNFSLAFGATASASGVASSAFGYETKATADYQTVIGKFNATDSNKAFIIGKGNESARSNALTVDWSGNLGIAGKVQSLYRITSTTVATGSISANSAKSATNYDITDYSTYINAGYEPVAISGDATDNSAISAFARIYDVSGTKKIRATFRNNSSSAVSTSYYFYILWLKATSA